MGYCKEFQLLIDKEDFANFLKLWEEYCQGDIVDGEEIAEILNSIKNSSFTKGFGKYAETILSLWKQVTDEKMRDEILRLAVDLQATNSPIFADLATDYLKQKYGSGKDYNEMLRLVGLRGRHNFQGAISNFELLLHMKKGNFVFHTGGWGVGEIIDVSLIREHALIEFEGIGSLKDLSFENAFRNLTPLPSDHFLARRFGNPDVLEKEGKENPLALIHMLLRDLGPKNSLEIKEELSDLVIPESDWTRWWQIARIKIKKDTKIQSPKHTKEPYILRKEAVAHDAEFTRALDEVKTTRGLITTVYNYLRDFSEIFKKSEIKEEVKNRLEAALNQFGVELSHKIQLGFLLEELFPQKYAQALASIVTSIENPEAVVSSIDIALHKKRLLILMRELRADYYTIFSHLLFLVPQNLLRDYLFKELSVKPELLKEKLSDLLDKVTVYPEAFFWYLQKLVTEDNLPLGDIKNKRFFLEAFFVLLHYVEDKEEYRDLVKKMHNFLSQKRYLVFREIIQEASFEYLLEVLLLASKCQTISKSELRTLRSLAEVVQPALKEVSKESGQKADEIIWTTAEGYKKTQERLQHIGTIETIDNAREIEAARALGDLRENSEYKFALERRARLQGELKTLSRQIHQARILTKEDIIDDEVGVGSIVDIVDAKGNKTTYVLLGPWDADPEKHILSFQSKFATLMIGHKKGDEFHFQGEQYRIESVKSYL